MGDQFVLASWHLAPTNWPLQIPPFKKKKEEDSILTGGEALIVLRPCVQWLVKFQKHFWGQGCIVEAALDPKSFWFSPSVISTWKGDMKNLACNPRSDASRQCWPWWIKGMTVSMVTSCLICVLTFWISNSRQEKALVVYTACSPPELKLIMQVAEISLFWQNTWNNLKQNLIKWLREYAYW